jgi:uncharacterized protein YodC (DUF2158 family)
MSLETDNDHVEIYCSKAHIYEIVSKKEVQERMDNGEVICIVHRPKEPKAPDETFSVGDVVCLKSGGPWMTVLRIGNEKVNCGWFPPQYITNEISVYRESLFAKKSLDKRGEKKG